MHQPSCQNRNPGPKLPQHPEASTTPRSGIISAFEALNPKPYKALNPSLQVVEAKKLERQYPHALKVKYRESQH